MDKCTDCLIKEGEDVDLADLLNIIPYIPYSILKELSFSKCCAFEDHAKNMEGSILFFDIVKFSPLVFSFIDEGNSGVESVNKILTEYYTMLILPIRQYGGTVYQFAGDSILVGFDPRENESSKQNIERALSSFSEFMMNLEIFNRDFMSKYNMEIKIRAGMSYGSYTQIIIGSKEHSYTATITGKAVAQAIEAEDDIEPNQFSLSPSVLKHLTLPVNIVVGKSKKYILEDNYFNAVDFNESFDIPFYMENPLFYKRCLKFINNEIMKRALSGFEILNSEHRDVTCLLMRFDGLDYDNNQIEAVKDLNRFYSFVQVEADRYGGTLLNADLSDKGNVFIILFGAPLALEKKELLALQLSIKLYREQKKYQNIKKLQFGISTGMAYCGDFGTSIRKDYSIVGNVINIAARLMTFSNKTGIYLDEYSRSRVNDGYIYKELGNIKLKGISQEVNIYKLHSIRSIKNKDINLNSGSKIIGRESEIKELTKNYIATQNSNGNCTGIVADAGIGKTLLVNTFLSKIDKTNSQVITAKCYIYEKNTIFFIWREFFINFFEIPLKSNKTETYNIIKKYFTQENYQIQNKWLPLILKIMGYDVEEHSETINISSEQKEKILFSIITNIIIKKSKEKLLVIFIEDVHWIDVKSLTLLKHIISQIGGEKIYIIYTSRTNKFSDKLLRYNHFIPMPISTLKQKDALVLARYLLKLKEPNIILEEKIVKSSQCNPFFIDTIVKSIKEKKMITPDETGTYSFNGDVKEFEIPSSIKNVILSRIDSLNSKEQVVIKTASVIGPNFSYNVLSNMLDNEISNENELETSLNILESQDLMNIEDMKVKSYMFKHMSIRDVVYQTLLHDTKSRLNLTLAKYLEASAKNEVFSYVERLALHFYNGGDLEKALYYSIKSAKKAKSLFASQDVINHNLKAIEICKKRENEEGCNLKDTLFKTKLDLIRTYRVTGQYIKALEICEILKPQTSNNYNLALIYKEMGHIYQEMGDMKKSITISETGLKLLGLQAPDTKLKTYLSIAKQIVIRGVNNIKVFRNLEYSIQNKEKYKLIVDLLAIVNRIYYFDMLEKSLWSAVIQYNISEHINDKSLLSYAATDYAVAMVSSGAKKLGKYHFQRGLEIAKNSMNPRVDAICNSRYALFYLFHNNSLESNMILDGSIQTFRNIGEMWELMTALGTQGQNYYNIANYEKSRVSYLEADSIAKDLQSLAHQAWKNCKVTFIDYLRGDIDYSEAVIGLNNAIDISTTARDTMNLCITYGHLIEMAIIHNQKKEIDRLIKLIIKSNKDYIADIPHIRISLAYACEGAVHLATLSKDNIKKEQYLDQARYCLKWLKRLNKNYTFLTGTALIAESKYETCLGNLKTSRNIIIEVIDYLEKSPYKRELALAYKEASKVLSGKKQEYYLKYNELYKDLGLKVV